VLIYDNLAIFKPGGQNCVVALNKNNGQEVWASHGFAAGPEYSSCLPIVFGNLPMIVTGTREGIVCVNAKNGALLWGNKFAANNTANCPTPAYGDGYVFWANGYGKGGICLKLAPGGKAAEAWTTHDMECHHGGYIIDNGYIYGNNGGGWACLELKSGKRMWQEHAVGKGSLCWAHPVVVGGRLYLRYDNNLYCFDVKAP